MYETYFENFSEAPESDAEVGDLFSRAQDCNPFALEQLVDRHRDEVYSFLLYMTRSQTVAAELTVESFFSTHRRLKEFRNEAGYAASLRRTAAECALRESRADTREGRIERQLEWPAPSSIDRSRGALGRAIEQALDQLPTPERQIFLLKELAELSNREIAAISNHSIPAIKNCLHQARLSLREAIDRFHRNRLD
jgi:RNA polymerase sigma-70 factor (ECF subfamily)